MDHAKIIFGTCNGHIWPSSTSRVTKALKFSRLSQLSTRDIVINSLFLGPCQDPIWTILGHFLVKLHFQASYSLTHSKLGQLDHVLLGLSIRLNPKMFWFLFFSYGFNLEFLIFSIYFLVFIF